MSGVTISGLRWVSRTGRALRAGHADCVVVCGGELLCDGCVGR